MDKDTISEIIDWDTLQEDWENPKKAFSEAEALGVWQEIKPSIFPEKKKASNSKKLYYLVAAAVIALLIMVATPFIFDNSSTNGLTDATQWEVLTATNVEGSEFVLSDGSVVRLTPNSQIQIPTHFSDNRTVKLTGSAYFNVAKDSQHPFVVENHDWKYEVLGTIFKVENNTGITEVQLFEGKLKVTNTSLQTDEILSTGQSLSHNTTSLLEKPHLFYDNQLGYIDFNQANLFEILAYIEGKYNVTFTYVSPLKDKQITMRITQGQSLEKIIQHLSLLTSYQFQQKGNKIEIQ